MVDPTLRWFVIGSLLWVGGVCAATPLVKQDATAEIPAVGEQVPSNWITKCDDQEEGSVCTIEHTILLAKTRQQLLTVTVKIESGAALPALMIRLPLGLFLPDGVEVQIDKQLPQQLAVQTCNAEGCYAGSAVSSDMLASLMGGERLTVTFRNLAKEEMTVPVPLAGFGPAFRQVQ